MQKTNCIYVITILLLISPLTIVYAQEDTNPPKSEIYKINVNDNINLFDSVEVVRIKAEYIDNISVEITPSPLEGTLVFRSDEFSSSVKYEILINESIIRSKYPNSNIIFEDLIFNYEGKNVSLKYDPDNHRYFFEEDNINIIGDNCKYPLDKYIEQINVYGGELSDKTKIKENRETGFKLDVNYIDNTIIIQKSRNIISVYLISLFILMISGFILNSHVKNLNSSHLTQKKKIELTAIIITILSFTLLLFGNLNFIVSFGGLPHFIFIIFFYFKILKI